MNATWTRNDERYAVVLNGNAGRVTPRLRRTLSAVVPKDRLYFTESPEHAREVLTRAVERDVHTIFAGGGDGTIVDTINTLEGFRADVPRLPAVGVLRLGTGNALARYLGSGAPIHTLRRWTEGHLHRVQDIHMVESEGSIFPFAGLGHDAAVVNDYIAVKKMGRGRWWEKLSTGFPGYLIAGLLKTVPNYLTRSNPTVTVTNLGAPARKVDVDGRYVGEPIPTGGIIYRGPAALIGAATTPLYGYGMRMFPHATLAEGRFQLRVVDMNAAQCVWNLVSVFRGRCAHPGLHDFLLDRVRVRFDDAVPYQLGGDAKGYRQEMTFSLARYPVTMVGQA